MRLFLVIVSSLVVAVALTLFGVSTYLGLTSGMMDQPMGAMALIEPGITALIGVMIGAAGLVLADIARQSARSAVALEALVRAGAASAQVPSATQAQEPAAVSVD